MYPIFKKEINLYLSSLTGYITIGIFLVMTWLFVWIFQDSGILDYGFSTLEPFFNIAPYLFLFLIPAVCMRMIAEETKTGTIELLVTKPISEWQIIFGKYLAALLLVAIALLPTLIYYASIYMLGAQKGNIDTGATIGSYIGLFLLSSTMVAVGIFTTSLTDNQVIAFLLAVFICFIMITGFDSLSALPVFNKIAYTLTNLGINAHYQSLSRGVMDSRDVLYFLSVDALFLLLSKTMLDTRKW